MELWEGTLQSTLPREEQQKINRLISTHRTLAFDTPAAIIAAELRHQLKKEPIDLEDTMIAGIALNNRMNVVTRDAHFTRIPGLRVLKY